MEEQNPFRVPEARVADPGYYVGGDFLPEGRKVPAGNGWNWIVQGWEMFKLSPGMWIALILIYMVIAFAAGMIPFIGGLITNLFMPVVMGGIMLGCKALDEGGELQINHLFAGFSDHFGQLVLVGALYLGGIFIVFMPVGILAAILIPIMAASHMESMTFVVIALIVLIATALIIPLVMAYWFAPPLVVFHAMPPIDAMKASFFACLKNFVPFLIYGLAFIPLMILAALPCFMGFLVLSPVIMASIYTSYRDIFIQE